MGFYKANPFDSSYRNFVNLYLSHTSTKLKTQWISVQICLNASGQYDHLFLLLPTHNYVIHGSQLFSDLAKTRQLQCTCHTKQDLVQAPFQVKTSYGFCSQAQIWFTARNAPVKTSNGFCSLFFPVTGMQNLHHTSSVILFIQENWDDVTRTRAICVPNAALYQTELHPKTLDRSPAWRKIHENEKHKEKKINRIGQQSYERVE